jgi:restriction system protein
MRLIEPLSLAPKLANLSTGHLQTSIRTTHANFMRRSELAEPTCITSQSDLASSTNCKAASPWRFLAVSLTESEDHDTIFVNREAELAWLFDHIYAKRSTTTIQISGTAGIGKTALITQFLRSNSLRERAIFLRDAGQLDFDRLDYIVRDRLYTTRQRQNNLSIVVLDDVQLSVDDIERLQRAVFNRKSIRALILTQREGLPWPRHSHLYLAPLSLDASLLLLRRLVGDSISIPSGLLELIEGHPLAIRLIAGLLRTHDPNTLVSSLQGALYQLKNQILVPQRELITSVRPSLVLANEQLLERLKARPQDIHQIDHRKFEELIAELLKDMNFDVELTPATRDGGRDVLAYWNSPIGRLLCLVEAKKNRLDRPVGIQIVRGLYGTLMDEQATSAMLVTTSDFSSEARKFERRHRWQLALKNYTDLVQWIENYKNPKRKASTILRSQ